MIADPYNHIEGRKGPVCHVTAQSLGLQLWEFGFESRLRRVAAATMSSSGLA